MGALKIEFGPETQELSMKAIEVLPEQLQTRAKLDPLYVRKYHDDMKHQAKIGHYLFPPVLVYHLPDGRLVLADGFHRYEAKRKGRFPTIKAVVIAGTMEDALLKGVEMNLDPMHSRKVEAEDRKHAAEIMIRNPELRPWSDVEIARRCGLSNGTIKRVRNDLHMRERVPIPDRVLSFRGGKPTGHTMPYHRRMNQSLDFVPRKQKSGRYMVKVAGRKIPLGRNLDTAQARCDEISATLSEARASLGTSSDFSDWLANRRVYFEVIGDIGCPLTGLAAGCVLVFPVAEPTTSAFLREIGRSILVRVGREFERIILVGYRGSSRLGETIAAAAALGIEFLTPEELVAEFGPKGDADAAGGSPAEASEG